MPSGALEDAVSGGRPQGKVTFSNSRWEERRPKSGGKERGMLVIDCEMQVGPPQELQIDAGLTEWYEDLAYIEEGKFLDKSDEPSEQYKFRTNSPIMKFFASLQSEGFSAKKLRKIGGEPGVLDGITVVLGEEEEGREYDDPKTGKKRVAKDVIVESLVSDNGGGGSKAASKSKPTASAATKRKAVPVEEEDEEDEVEQDEDGTEDADEEEDDNPALANAIETVKGILAEPKKYVKNWTRAQFNGGVAVKSLKDASLGAITAVTGIKATKDKQAVWNEIMQPDFFAANAEDNWTFDKKKGVVSEL